MRTIIRALLVGSVCALAAGSAHAQGGYIWTLGVSVEAAPAYEGASHYSALPLPVIRLRNPDRPYRFVPPDDGFELALVDSDIISLGPVGRFQGSRDNKGSLAGMEKIDWAGELGAFVDIWATEWLRAHVEIRKGVTGHDGWVGDAGLDFIYTGRGWDFSAGPRVGYGDASYRNTYFGVTPAETFTSPYFKSVYTPGGGLRYYGAETALSFQLTRAWQTIFDVGYHSLDSDLADSPIVKLDGSQDQWNAGVTVTYTFGQ